MTRDNPDGEDADAGGLPGLAKDAVEDVKGAASDAAEQVTSALDWMPDPHQCGKCGTECEPTATFVRKLAEYHKTWKCPECGAEYYRAEPWDDDGRVPRFDRRDR